MIKDRERQVAAVKGKASEYPKYPYNPTLKYPELAFLPYSIEVNSHNELYQMVRGAFYLYGLDLNNYNTPNWNPLTEFVSKGQTVIIKPNLVRDIHSLGKKGVLSTVTHASILRPIIDYTLLALKGEGKIIVCDVPLQSANFNKICALNGLAKLMAFYESKDLGNVQLMLIDLRGGNSTDYTIIDLGENSFHSEIDQHWDRYVVTGYELGNLRDYHTSSKHCYPISNTILSADIIISIPKLKTHKKAGITVCLKNFIGVVFSKDFLPHHRMGIPAEGGDEYPAKLVRSVKAEVRETIGRIIMRIPLARDLVSLLWRTLLKWRSVESYEIAEGNWHGNDTLWRTILDVNAVTKYASKNGTLKYTPQRKFLFLVDGILGQEGEGPMHGEPKKCGLLLLGTNPCAVDYAATKIMGLNYKHVNQVTEAFESKDRSAYPLVDFDTSDVKVTSETKDYAEIHKLSREKSLKFVAPGGWKILELAEDIAKD